MQIGCIDKFAGGTIKSLKCTEASVVLSNGNPYLRLVCEGTLSGGGLINLIFPVINLVPKNIDVAAGMLQRTMEVTFDCLEGFNISEAEKEMTKKEIEEILGYPIKIKEE